jgi:integrase
MNKPLIVKKRDKVKGLYVFCKKCKKTIDSKICGETGKGLRTCKDIEQHCFRGVVTVPNTNGAKRKTRVFNTQNVEEAIRLKFEFDKELTQTNYQLSTNHIMSENIKPSLLIDCMATYIGFLNNEGVEEHKKKIRSIQHVKDVERYFKYFALCLKTNQIDHMIFRISQLNDKIVGLFHNYLLTELNYKNKTYNKVISQLKHFMNWLIQDRKYDLENPFVGVTRRQEVSNNLTITKEEFSSLLDKVLPENGIVTHSNGLKRNLYRSWMIVAFKLALETGLRREEFMTLKYSDIKEGEGVDVLYIQVENFKVNRLMGKEKEARQYKSIPVTVDLKELLIELNYEENKGKDIYLIGSDDKSSRETLLLIVSKAFSHFWKFTGSSKKANLKHLRKTYLTALVKHFGDKATMISNHSGIEVLKKHYVNSQQLVSATTNFKVL